MISWLLSLCTLLIRVLLLHERKNENNNKNNVIMYDFVNEIYQLCQEDANQ